MAASMSIARVQIQCQTQAKLASHPVRVNSIIRPAPAGRVALTKPASALRCNSAARSAVNVTASAAQVEELNSKFGIKDRVSFVEGRGGLPTVVLNHACGSSAEIALFGGCILSWKQASGDEVLYIRPDAVFDKSKPISGGVPLCFPQFGPGEMQQHGFARNLDWEVAATSADPQPDDRDPEVQLVLTDNEYTRKMFPHAFKVVYSISLHGETLKTDWRVVNTGDSTFSFAAALHTYFEVAGIEKAKVLGLKGLVRLIGFILYYKQLIIQTNINIFFFPVSLP
jgi:glucose-6-phosphate 1-epimerase